MAECPAPGRCLCSSPSLRARRRLDALQPQEALLEVEELLAAAEPAAAVAAQRAVAGDHAMAGDQKPDRVAPHRSADCPRSPGLPDPPGHLAVRRGGAARNRAHALQDAAVPLAHALEDDG